MPRQAAGLDDPRLWLPEDRYRRDGSTCIVCGLTYVRELEEDRKLHHKYHARAMAVLTPKPEPRIVAALNRGIDLTIVSPISPAWAQKAMYERAHRFHQETGYRIMWEENGELGWDAAGHLLLDDTGIFEPRTIVGAAAFRFGEWTVGEPCWELQWIWITPKTRRLGILTRAWPAFVDRYGDFFIEPPLSTAMKAAVAKFGR